MRYTATTALVSAPHRLVAVEHEGGPICVDVSPFTVDLLAGPEAAPLRERLAGYCYTLDLMGVRDDPWFTDSMCEHLRIVVLRRCLEHIPHHCAVKALEDSWKL
jgi:hypothetical protein